MVAASAFGPEDGYLYVTTGDTHNAEVSAEPDTVGAQECCRIDSEGEGRRRPPMPRMGFRIRGYSPMATATCRALPSIPETYQPIPPNTARGTPDEITALVRWRNAGLGSAAQHGRDRGDCPDGYCGYEPQQMEELDPAERRAYMRDDGTPRRIPTPCLRLGNNNGPLGRAPFRAVLSHAANSRAHGKVAWRLALMGIGFGGTPVGQRNRPDRPRRGWPFGQRRHRNAPAHGIRPIPVAGPWSRWRSVLPPSTRVTSTASRRNKATLAALLPQGSAAISGGTDITGKQHHAEIDPGRPVALALVFATPIFAQEAMTI